MGDRRKRWPGLVLLFSLLALAACERAPDELARQAQDAMASGDTEAAKEQLAAVVEGYPDHPKAAEARYWLAEIARTVDRDHRQAKLGYQSLIRRFAGTPLARRARWRLAELYEGPLENPRRAVVEYARLAESAPEAVERSRAHRAAGRCYEALGDYEQALVEYKQALADGPGPDEVAETLWRKASVLYVMGLCSEAREAYARIIDEHPKSPWRLDAELSSASCLEEQGELAEALKAYNSLAARYPANPVIPKRLEAVKRRIAKRKR